MQTPHRGGKRLNPIRWFWLATVAVILLDLASKAFIFQLLGGGPPPPGTPYTDANILWLLPGAFRLICHYNTGGAFGWGAGNIILFLGAAAVLVPALVLTAYHCKEPDAPLWALGLIVGGALGNLYDRLFHVGVRDFLEILNPKTGYGLWPVFNLADIAIVFGVFVYLVWSVIDAARRKRLARLERETAAREQSTEKQPPA